MSMSPSNFLYQALREVLCFVPVMEWSAI